MNDLVAIAETMVRDPIVSAFALMGASVLVTRLLFKQHPIGRAVSRLVFFILITLLLLHGGIVPYQPQHPDGTPFRDAFAGLLKIAWWVWAAWFLVGLLRSVVVLERPREGKLLQDLLSGLIYLAAAFAIIAYVFALPIQGLLVTSGAIAIILGLALQSTLSDVFSGLVLSFSHPYRPGDWIKLEGGTEGRVIEMNWRATLVLTAQRDLAILPNSTIAKSKIVNVSSPTGIHGMTVVVQLASGMPPASGTNILELALLNSRKILTVPQPTVRVVSVDAAHTAFELTFFVGDLDLATAAQNELFDLIFRHVAAAGAVLGSPFEDSPKIERTPPERTLDLVAIFASLTPQERTALAGKLKRVSYELGETVLEPGVVLQSLFIVGSGVLSVKRNDGGGDSELLRLGPADHFGERGLLTKTSGGVKITALAPSIIYELAKNDLAPVLEARPPIAQELSHALAQRQSADRAVVTDKFGKSEPTKRLSAWFSERMHELFELGGAK